MCKNQQFWCRKIIKKSPSITFASLTAFKKLKHLGIRLLEPPASENPLIICFISFINETFMPIVIVSKH